jgi:hypothetical protein
MKQDKGSNIEEKDKQLAQRWIDAAHAGQLYNTDYDELCKLMEKEDGFLFNLDWPGFGQLDTFPFSAISLENCIFFCEGTDDEEAVYCFRNQLKSDGHADYFFLREIIASDGRSAWMLVRCVPRGQLGTGEEIEGLFATPLAAEKSLRADGYIFTGATPSGKTDSFTDDEIVELVRKADK